MSKSAHLKACLSMTFALCFHYFGYECARVSSITLLSAKVIIMKTIFLKVFRLLLNLIISIQIKFTGCWARK